MEKQRESRDFNRKVKRKLRRCARGKCIQRVANRIVMVVSTWFWVVGLRCCAIGNCIQRVEDLQIALSWWCQRSCKSHCHGGVKVGLRRCARGKCTHRVANRIRKWEKIKISIGKCLESDRKIRKERFQGKGPKVEISKRKWPKSRDINRKVVRKWQKVQISIRKWQ